MWENLTPVVFSLISDLRPLTSSLRLAVSPRPRVVSLLPHAPCPMLLCVFIPHVGYSHVR